MRFNQLLPGKEYIVVSGANDTFLLGAHIKISLDAMKIHTSNAGHVGNYRQPAWIELKEIVPEHYLGVEFVLVSRENQ